MSSSTQLDTTTVVLLLLGAVLLLPLLVMGIGGGMMGYGGMMGGYDTTVGWWPVWMLVPITVLLVLLGGGYLVARRLTDSQTARSPALEELRLAYARGDLTDDEFERRRAKLIDDES